MTKTEERAEEKYSGRRNEAKEEKKKSKEERRGSQDKIKTKVSSLPKIKMIPQTHTFL